MATSLTLFESSGGSSSSNSVHESVELRSRNKNHSAATSNAGTVWRQESPPSSMLRPQLVEHVVRRGETLMQISLMYSVPVSEIKRVNNIVADHEIHAFPAIKVPLSRSFLLKRQLLEASASASSSFSPADPAIFNKFSNGHSGLLTSASCDGAAIVADDLGGGAHFQQAAEDFSDYSLPLLADQNVLLLNGGSGGSNDSLNSSNGGGLPARQKIEGILDEADKTVAAIRQNLPTPGLEGGGGGAFHFVNAGVPDNSSNIWIIVAIVVIIFVLLPLGLTFLEETGVGELGENNEQQQNHQQNEHFHLHHNHQQLN